jgi:molecular chaperone GrpE
MKPNDRGGDGALDILEVIEQWPSAPDDRSLAEEARPAALDAAAPGPAAPQQRRTDAERSAARRLLREILAPLDALESCVRERHDLATLEDAVRVTLRAVWDAFRPYNLERVKGSGMPFDPRVHEAAEVTPSTRVPPNTVLETLRAGYLLENELVRPALVRVSVEAPSGAGNDGGEER